MVHGVVQDTGPLSKLDHDERAGTSCGSDAILRGAQILREGGVVAMPTETVYGLGAHALLPEAVAKIFELKGRPRFDPLIVHVPDLAAAQALALSFPERALHLAERFWPGPLTLVVEKSLLVPDIVTAGLPCVGLRVPDHPVALALLRAAGVPVAAPSANLFGRTSPTTADHVRADFGGWVEVLDGGPCRRGIESTVLAVPSEGMPVLLRPGAVPLEALSEVVGRIALGHAESHLRPPAPGMLARHYAPRTPLFFGGDRPPFARVGWLGIGQPEAPEAFAVVVSLSVQGDLAEAAAQLFRVMRELDGCGLDAIWAQPLPEAGLGCAINDRLRRAGAR